MVPTGCFGIEGISASIPCLLADSQEDSCFPSWCPGSAEGGAAFRKQHVGKDSTDEHLHCLENKQSREADGRGQPFYMDVKE